MSFVITSVFFFLFESVALERLLFVPRVVHHSGFGSQKFRNFLLTQLSILVPDVRNKCNYYSRALATSVSRQRQVSPNLLSEDVAILEE